MVATLLHDAVVKATYWTLTSYTIVRAGSGLLSLLCLIYWAACTQSYGSPWIGVSIGLCSLLSKLATEMLYVGRE